MLILTNRQTEDDKKFYKQYDYFDSLNSITQIKLENSLNIISEFVNNNKCYCSVSWGKDSTVLVHLVSKLKLKIPMIWIKEKPFYNPDCEIVRDHFIKNNYIYSYHEFTCDYGNIPYKNFCDKNGNPSLFYDTCNLLKKNFGARITGIRNDESNKRKLRYLTYGYSTENTCAPLSNWSINDIFAYIYQNELPLNPAYGCLINGHYSRNNIRVDCIGGFEADSFGRALWEKTYYPEIVNRYCL